MNNKKCRVYKKTRSDWCPSYTNNHGEQMVEVTMGALGQNICSEWRVGVWGSDDMGMVQDFIYESDALICFLDVIRLEYVNIENIDSMNFKMF